MDDPPFLIDSFEELQEAFAVGEGVQQGAPFKHCLQLVLVFAAEFAFEKIVIDVVPRYGLQCLGPFVNAAPGDDHVHMYMVLLGLPKGMQDRNDPWFEIVLVAHPILKGIGRSSQKDVQQVLAVVLNQVVELMGQGHHHMAMGQGQHLTLDPFGPFHGVLPAAGGAEAVLAAVVDFGHFATFGAGIVINAQCLGPAHADGIDGFVLLRSDVLAGVLLVNIPPPVKKIS